MRRRLNLERLRALLAASRISQNHWAIRLGLSRGHWSDLVNGRHPFPSAKTRERMAEVFGVPEADLFTDEPETGASDDLLFRRAVGSRFTITGEIGHGGMGTVYLALDTRLGRVVALKVVTPEATAGVGAEQLLKEIGHVAKLQHPHILPLHDAGNEAGHPYYVMPYVREGSLRALLERRVRLSVGEALSLIDGIADALHYAHGQRTLHCDVKPENVLVQGAHAFVMDFGIARKLHSEADEWAGLRKELDFSAGTPAYVSPEQAAGDRALDQRSDVYSLACVAYEMLAGRAPFSGTTTREIVSLRFRAPPPPIRDFAPDVPEAVASVLARAMSVDPDKRPESAMAFAGELHHAARGRSSMLATITVAASRALARTRAWFGAAGPARLRVPFTGAGQDLHHTVRSLRRDWRFAAGVVLSLAFGIGLCVPALSLADHLLLRRPPGIADADRVVRLSLRVVNKNGAFYQYGLTGQDYSHLASARTLSRFAGYIALDMSLGRGAEAKSINAVLTTASYFDALGVRLAAGRPYDERDDVDGARTAPCVVSWRFWKRSMNGAADAIGRTLQIGEVSYIVSGIAPEAFNGLGFNAVDVFLPIHVAAPDFQGHDAGIWTNDHSAWLQIVARLAPGTSVEAANAEANTLYRLPAEHVRDKERQNTMGWVSVLPGAAPGSNRNLDIARWMLGGAALLFLLIAANLVNLFIARTAANARQTAVRLAVGGGARHILRLHFMEALTLGALAAGLGSALAAPAVAITRALMFPAVTWTRPLVDVRIAGMALLLTIVTAMAVATWATLGAMRIDPAELLRAGGGARSGDSRGRQRLRSALLVVQAAMFAILLSGSAAFVLSLRRAAAIDPGFTLEGLVVAQARLRGVGFTAEREREHYVAARERVAALPNVASASLSYMEPWQNNTNFTLHVSGSDAELPGALFDFGTPEYLETMGARMKDGRWIGADDRAGTAQVIVVNEAFAKAAWGTAPALGQCVRVGADSMPCRSVVGVVRDFRVTGGVEGAMTPVYYLPFAQLAGYPQSPRMFVRMKSARAETMGEIRRVIQAQAPDAPAATAHLVSDNIGWLTGPLQLGAMVFSAYGLLAALIAAIGLSALLSFVTSDQRRSYAIRLALGSTPDRVVRPVIRTALLLVGGGLVLGLVSLIPVRRMLEPLLFHTKLIDAPVAAVVLGMGAIIALMATIAPVRRIVKIEPMRVLREE